LERRPTSAFISTSALRHNYREIRKRLTDTTKVMAVVKANAYGHGDGVAARVFEEEGCEYFGVAIPEEGANLRDAGIRRPIVVLGGVFPEQIEEVFRLDLTPVVFDLKTAALLNEAAGKRKTRKEVHVKIDTGMGRLGVLPDGVEAFFRGFKGFANLKLEGVLSHFADADSTDKKYSETQLSVFTKCLEAVRRSGLDTGLVHMGNSAAIVDMKASHFNMVRPGIMLYGSCPASHFAGKIGLRAALELKTRVLLVKTLAPGDSVSYGRSFVAKRRSRVAVLPVGYGDGLPRGLSGKGTVLIRGQRALIAGAVCMDLVMCDVTDIGDAEAGDEAVIIGAQGKETITAEEVAEKTGTISYEIFCGISGRVPRIYV